MKIKEYTPKARAAFGQTLVEIGQSIFKGIILLLTIFPLSYIIRTTLEKSEEPLSFFTMVDSMTNGSKVLFLLLLIISFILGDFFRSQGLKHIHQSEILERALSK